MAAHEVHHEILCAVIQQERTDPQALTPTTLHNAPLYIGSGRRNLPRWHPVDFLPSALLLARTGALLPVPPIVPAVSARSLRLGQVTVLF